MTEPYKSLESRVRETMRQHIVERRMKLTTKVLEEPKPQPEVIKEEVEPVEEVSKQKLNRYIDKARDDQIQKHFPRDGKIDNLKISNRNNGIKLAHDKLKKHDGNVQVVAKEDIEPTKEQPIEELAPTQSAPDPMKAKMDAQKAQVTKQKDQLRMQLAQQKAAKQEQAMKAKGEKSLEKIKEGKDVFDHHQSSIAKKTLKMHDAAVGVMGGMNKEQARSHLKKMGWSDKRIHDHEHGTVKEELELTEMQTVKNKGDHDVMRAFANKQTHQSKKLSTDGTTLHGNWMGGHSIAHWDGDKVRFRTASSRSEQAVHRALRKKHLAPGDIHEAVEELDERQVQRVRSYGRASKLQQLHIKQSARLSRTGDRAGAEQHRKRAIEYKRVAYAARDNPGKLPAV